jgi:hypothetical protein
MHGGQSQERWRTIIRRCWGTNDTAFPNRRDPATGSRQRPERGRAGITVVVFFCRSAPPAGEIGSQRTRRWRKTDSNPRSPLWPRSVRQGPTVSPLPLQTHSRQPRSLADYREASVRNSSALKRIDADARFSSRCAIEEVPGIGSMAGERCSSQASAIWLGVAPWL